MVFPHFSYFNGKGGGYLLKEFRKTINGIESLSYALYSWAALQKGSKFYIGEKRDLSAGQYCALYNAREIAGDMSDLIIQLEEAFK